MVIDEHPLSAQQADSFRESGFVKLKEVLAFYAGR